MSVSGGRRNALSLLKILGQWTRNFRKRSSWEFLFLSALRTISRARTLKYLNRSLAAVRQRERERERVTNYLKLPNNSTTFCRKTFRFPVPRTYLYDIREDAAESRCYLIRSLDDSCNECKDKQRYPDLQAKCKNYAEILRKRNAYGARSCCFHPPEPTGRGKGARFDISEFALVVILNYGHFVLRRLCERKARLPSPSCEFLILVIHLFINSSN